MNKLILGNSLEKLKELEDNSIDSIVTDPPYHLVSIVKRFGKKGSALAQYGKDGSFGRLSKGFMGKEWDGVDENGIGIAYNVDLWAECLRVLKPGGYLLAFSGTRTYHRMAVAIEDAGFEVRDMIEWVYGSGFPKSLNIGKAVDKIQGNDREIIGKLKYGDKSKEGYNPYHATKETQTTGHILSTSEPLLTKGTSKWEGWGTALKPSHEPICMARKPLAEKNVANNVLKWGTGGINIDESRVEYQGDADWNNTFRPSTNIDKNCWIKDKNAVARVDIINRSGRFPANLLHDNSDEVKECFPETKNGGQNNTSKRETWLRQETEPTKFSGDSGSASRFFKSIIYNPKASKAERNKGCEGLEEKQTTGGGGLTAELREDGSLETSSAGGKYGSIKAVSTNSHPTVKPIALMEYLIKMVTSKGGTVLDPFMGSGSTGVAAKKNGYDFIGIDMTPEYIEIAKARINAIEIENKLI